MILLLLAEVDDLTTLALIAKSNHQAIHAFEVRPVVATIGSGSDFGIDELRIDAVLVAEPNVIGAFYRAHSVLVTRMAHANFAEWIWTRSSS